MRRTPLLATAALPLLALAAPGQILPTISPRVSTYVMQVELDPAEKTLSGRQTITWTNATSLPTSEVRLLPG